MAAIILFGILETEDNQNNCNLYRERLLSDPDDEMHSDDKTLINRYRCPRAMIRAATSVGEANEATRGSPGSRSTDQCTTAFFFLPSTPRLFQPIQHFFLALTVAVTSTSFKVGSVTGRLGSLRGK